VYEELQMRSILQTHFLERKKHISPPPPPNAAIYLAYSTQAKMICDCLRVSLFVCVLSFIHENLGNSLLEV
jgi:hypothetical protein